MAHKSLLIVSERTINKDRNSCTCGQVRFPSSALQWSLTLPRVNANFSQSHSAIFCGSTLLNCPQNTVITWGIVWSVCGVSCIRTLARLFGWITACISHSHNTADSLVKLSTEYCHYLGHCLACVWSPHPPTPLLIMVVLPLNNCLSLTVPCKQVQLTVWAHTTSEQVGFRLWKTM
jgi:hypothetical protein